MSAGTCRILHLQANPERRREGQVCAGSVRVRREGPRPGWGQLRREQVVRSDPVGKEQPGRNDGTGQAAGEREEALFAGEGRQRQ